VLNIRTMTGTERHGRRANTRVVPTYRAHLRARTSLRLHPATTHAAVVTAPLPRDHELEGGRVTDGPALDTRVRAAVEAARQIPVGFASYRNLRHASEGELWRETLPRLRELARGLQPSAAPGLLEHVQTLVQIYGDAFPSLFQHSPRHPIIPGMRFCLRCTRVCQTARRRSSENT